MKPVSTQTGNPRTMYALGHEEAKELRATHDRMVRRYRQAIGAGQTGQARAIAAGIKFARTLMLSHRVRQA